MLLIQRVYVCVFVCVYSERATTIAFAQKNVERPVAPLLDAHSIPTALRRPPRAYT